MIASKPQTLQSVAVHQLTFEILHKATASFEALLGSRLMSHLPRGMLPSRAAFTISRDNVLACYCNAKFNFSARPSVSLCWLKPPKWQGTCRPLWRLQGASGSACVGWIRHERKVYAYTVPDSRCCKKQCIFWVSFLAKAPPLWVIIT